MKRFSTLLAVLVAVVGLASPSLAADTIKLGVAGPHSGDLAPYGIPAMKAAQLVVKKVNAAGGVLGKQVELLIQDDQCKPEIATNTATKLVTQGAHVVLGHICSGATKAALGIYKDANIPVMSPSDISTGWRRGFVKKSVRGRGRMKFTVY
jgi:branched-chain amino acid transport system substrate-binding protein